MLMAHQLNRSFHQACFSLFSLKVLRAPSFKPLVRAWKLKTCTPDTHFVFTSTRLCRPHGRNGPCKVILPLADCLRHQLCPQSYPCRCSTWDRPSCRGWTHFLKTDLECWPCLLLLTYCGGSSSFLERRVLSKSPLKNSFEVEWHQLEG